MEIKYGHNALKITHQGSFMHSAYPLDLLKEARERYTQAEIAKILNVDVRTVRRWEVRDNDPPEYLSDAIRQRILPLMDTPSNDDSTFNILGHLMLKLS